MATLPNSKLETAPTGTLNKLGLINGNWSQLEKIFTASTSSADPVFGLIEKLARLQTTVENLTSGTSVAVDFATPRVKLCALSHNPTFSFSNLAAGRIIWLVLAAGGSSRTLTWPAGVKWAGTAKTTLDSGKVGIFGLISTGTTDAAVYIGEPGGGGGGTFVSLPDGPGAFTGKSLQVTRVNLGETALEYFTLDAETLPKGPGAFAGNAGKSIRLNGAGTALEFYTPAAATFAGLPDGPGAFAGHAGESVRVNGTGTGLEYFTPAAGTFVALTDGPGAFTGQALKLTRVNAGETGLEYVDAPTPGLTIGLGVAMRGAFQP